MNTPWLDQVLLQVEAANPAHGKKLRKRLGGLGPEYAQRAEVHFAAYDEAQRTDGRSLAFGVECYLALSADMVEERKKFLRTGGYSNTSYKAVEEKVYGRPEVMEYHMHGLALAQFLWPEQYERLRFFCDHLPGYAATARSYLEIGGGHGLYTKTALALLPPGTRIDLVDISASSLKLARQMIQSDAVTFTLRDLFEYESPVRYDLISIAEVIEHVEDPIAMMRRVGALLAPDGTVFATTPINAPMIDHIYLFRTVDEIRALLARAGFVVVREITVLSEDVPAASATKLKIPVMYAAFLRHAPPDPSRP